MATITIPSNTAKAKRLPFTGNLSQKTFLSLINVFGIGVFYLPSEPDRCVFVIGAGEV
jgi:hypothetical protein